MKRKKKKAAEAAAAAAPRTFTKPYGLAQSDTTYVGGRELPDVVAALINDLAESGALETAGQVVLVASANYDDETSEWYFAGTATVTT